MARIKGGLNAKKKHRRILKLAKGYMLSLIHIQMCIRDRTGGESTENSNEETTQETESSEAENTSEDETEEDEE